MTDLLLRIGISNLMISLAIAVVAWAVQAYGKRPRIAHLLWLLVLVKLVTPPILTLPVFAVPGLSATAAEPLAEFALPVPTAIAVEAPVVAADATGTAAASSPVELGKTGLALIWLLGSAWILSWSLVRVYRFNRLLGRASEPAPTELQRVAAGIAERLGLRATPAIHTTSAQLLPLVWWVGGRVRVLIPAVLPREMDAGQFRWILAHELAHVRRRDHLVRWLEWLACVAFWWNPVAWWARRNLRANEEICCDALVLESLGPDPGTYGNSLLTAVEFLASPALRPPAMASEINSGGILERRFKMINSAKPIRTTPRWLQALLLVCAVVVLPLGVAHAREPDYEAVAARLEAAVEAGELTAKQAEAMMGELARARFAERMKARDGRARPTREEMAAVKEKIRAGVKEGKISEEDAVKRWEGYLQRFRGGEAKARGAGRITREDYARAEAELEKAVEEGRISEEDARKRLEGMRRMIAGQGERGERRITREDYARAEAELEKMVEEGKISGEDARKRLGAMRKMIGGDGERSEGTGIEGHYERVGIDRATFDRIRGVLVDSGLEGKKAEQAMGGMLRVVHEMKSEGESFELNPRVKEYLLKDIGLTDKQFELVLGLSRRIAAGTKEQSRGEGGEKRRR